MNQNQADLDHLNWNIDLLLYCMIAWLGLISVVAVIVFVIVNVKLTQANRALDELEVGSVSTASSKRSRILDIFTRVEPPTFYNVDREGSTCDGQPVPGNIIKLPATDDECECVNGSGPPAGPRTVSSAGTLTSIRDQ